MKIASRKLSYIKQRKIFLNCMNSWFSNIIIEEFRPIISQMKIHKMFLWVFESTEIIVQPDANYNNQKVFENDIPYIFNISIYIKY